MDIERTCKPTLFVLAISFLTLGFISLLFILLRYTFVPVSGVLLNVITASIIIWFTSSIVKNKNEKTKIYIIFAAFLPLATLFFAITHGILWSTFIDTNIIDTSTYVIHSYVVLICSMAIFFSCKMKKAVKIVLSIIYCILIVSMLIILFIMLFIATVFANFGIHEVVHSEMSPNYVYLAEIINSDQGALGGNTLVTITRQNRNLNLLIGKFEKVSRTIYITGWGAFGTMTLDWETDEILYINGERHFVGRIR